MLLFFLLLNIIFFLMGQISYKKSINPVSVYVIIWVICVSIHESGLIIFYPLEDITWYILCGSETMYILGCLVGRFMSSRITYKTVRQSQEVIRNRVKIVTIVFSLLSLFPTMQRVINVMMVYGFNFISQIRQIYLDGITGKGVQSDYSVLVNLVFFTLPLAGYYVSTYKFEKFVILPIVVVILSQLTDGSRGSIVTGCLLFIAPFVLKGMKVKLDKRKMKFAMLGFGFIFLLITYIRGMTGQRPKLTYASSFLKKISGNSASLYRILSYMSNPIGALNEYLKQPTYNQWGTSTFRVFRKVLYKLGIVNDFSERVNIGIFHTPMETNVGTFLGDLIKDFRIFGMLVVCFLLGLIFAYSYYRMIKFDSIKYTMLASSCFGLVFLSFFDWYLKLIIFWISIILGICLGGWIEKGRKIKIVKINKKI